MNEATLIEKDGRYKIQLGELDQETADAVHEAVELFNRCRRGGVAEALAAIAVINRMRGERAGHAELTLEIHAGGGPTPNVDWRETLSFAPMSARSRKQAEEANEGEAYRQLAERGRSQLEAGKV